MEIIFSERKALKSLSLLGRQCRVPLSGRETLSRSCSQFSFIIVTHQVNIIGNTPDLKLRWSCSQKSIKKKSHPGKWCPQATLLFSSDVWPLRGEQAESEGAFLL